VNRLLRSHSADLTPVATVRRFRGRPSTSWRLLKLMS
jgi:hypothetical protein